jgi:hypothetical protein
MTDHLTEKKMLKVGFRWLILEEYSNKWNARMLETEIQRFIMQEFKLGFPDQVTNKVIGAGELLDLEGEKKNLDTMIESFAQHRDRPVKIDSEDFEIQVECRAFKVGMTFIPKELYLQRYSNRANL